jgi:hypothetical protein
MSNRREGATPRLVCTPSGLGPRPPTEIADRCASPPLKSGMASCQLLSVAPTQGTKRALPGCVRVHHRLHEASCGFLPRSWTPPRFERGQNALGGGDLYGRRPATASIFVRVQLSAERHLGPLMPGSCLPLPRAIWAQRQGWSCWTVWDAGIVTRRGKPTTGNRN